MGFRISTGVGPVRFNAPIPMAVVAGVLGLCCCGGIVNAFNGDDEPTETAATEAPRFVTTPSVTPKPVVDTTTSPAPKRTTAKPSPRPTVKKTTARPKPSPKPVKKTTAPPSTDRQYSTCKEANAHGLGPYYRGKDPEYYWYEDRDHDGKVCER